MKHIDDYFQEVAFSMGYRPEDLLPIDRAIVVIDSAVPLKGMSERKKEFYLNKKMATLLQRQNQIFQAVQVEVKKRQFACKLSKEHQQRLANPTMENILKEHELIVRKNQK